MVKRNRCLTFDIEARVHHVSSVPQRQPTTMYYAIVRMFDDFSDWEIIDGYDDEPSAEEAAEQYSERFPHAVIDVQPVYN